ncbi:Tyrosine recombinase XerD [subsurface metagenome]
MFSTLASEELIPENPLRDYRAPGVEESDPAALTADQMRLLLSQPDQSRPLQFRDFVMMSLFYDSKCRLSELAEMEVGRIDFQGRPPSFTVLGKGRGKGRRWLTYYFSPFGAKLLSRYLAARPESALGVTNVFLRHDGQPLIEERMYRQVRHYGEKAGIKVYPHMLRHSGAREHLRHGGNLPELQVLLNHKTLRSTMIYSKLGNEDARRAMARFSPLNALGVVPKKKR